MSYDQENERHKAHILYHENKYRVTNICELNTLLNLPFKGVIAWIQILRVLIENNFFISIIITQNYFKIL
jgi:hypothetical protein